MAWKDNKWWSATVIRGGNPLPLGCSKGSTVYCKRGDGPFGPFVAMVRFENGTEGIPQFSKGSQATCRKRLEIGERVSERMNQRIEKKYWVAVAAAKKQKAE